MTPKRLWIGALGLAIVAVLAIGLLQLPGSSSDAPPRLSAAQMRSRLAGSPAPLAALHAQANELLSGGLPALRARLLALRGRAVVVNKWASWCGPCRAEFGVFQRASTNLGREVAFIGIDSGDPSTAPAEKFLRSFPVSYPSYFDHSGAIGEAITDSSNVPVTVIYNGSGLHPFIHQGPYPSVAKLELDVRRYGLGS
jgi:cytochrome c biogenesis protein CcmG, thiol:disulfide interchange protein DsbE